MTDTDILLASIGAAHGIKGEVRVKSFTDDPLAFGDYGKLHDKQGRKYQVIKARVSKTVVVTRFKSVDTREKAELLNGIELFVDRSVLPEVEDENEFYVQDLVGCDVHNEADEPIGTVMDVPNFGAGDMIEVAPRLEDGELSEKTYFVPFTKAAVPAIDLKKRFVVVVPPEEVSEREDSEDSGQYEGVEK